MLGSTCVSALSNLYCPRVNNLPFPVLSLVHFKHLAVVIPKVQQPPLRQCFILFLATGFFSTEGHEK